jgi:hypothetical protein
MPVVKKVSLYCNSSICDVLQCLHLFFVLACLGLVGHFDLGFVLFDVRGKLNAYLALTRVLRALVFAQLVNHRPWQGTIVLFQLCSIHNHGPDAFYFLVEPIGCTLQVADLAHHKALLEELVFCVECHGVLVQVAVGHADKVLLTSTTVSVIAGGLD